MKTYEQKWKATTVQFKGHDIRITRYANGEYGWEVYDLGFLIPKRENKEPLYSYDAAYIGGVNAINELNLTKK